MLTCSVHHPEIETFITAKDNDTDVTGANISVRVTDEFLKSAKNESKYEQRFPVDSRDPTISNQTDAAFIWKKIIKSAHNRAEPGVLFWDTILRNSPADCYKDFKTISTNPCGEITLSANDSCRLLAINVFSCVVNPYTSKAYFDFEKFYDLSMKGQRLLDDLIDLELEKINSIIQKIEKDPEPEEIKRVEIELWEKIARSCYNGRRTGLGVTAVGDTIAAVGIKYGSDESIEFVDEVYKTLKFGSYRSSVEMSKELGPFPVWCWEDEMDCPFIKNFLEESILGGKVRGEDLYKDIAEFGRRNIANLTTAPTGTISILASIKVNDRIYFNISSGIEPVYFVEFTRRKKGNPGDKDFRTDFVDQNGDHWMEFTVYHSPMKAWMDATDKNSKDPSCPYIGATAPDINWVQRVKLQAAAQKHVDHSISSTVNLPSDVTEEEVEKIYNTAWVSGCKGITIYRDGCRSGVIIKKEDKPTITRTNAVERPKTLKCDIHTISVNKQKFTVIVGLMEGSPYEVFCVKDFIEREKHGDLTKVGKSRYVLHANEHKVELSNLLDDDSQNALMRMISAALRHGADIQFVVEQLQKTHGDMTSMTKSMARALKKYINDGVVSKESCPECGAKLTYQEGCLKCESCGHSKCG
jgi:ribonucleoside-diphosphate reductase alpha chain